MNNRPEGGGAEMPFLEHLEELRHRLFYCAVAVAIGAVAAFVIFNFIPGFDVIEFLSAPIRPYLRGGNLIYTHPGDAFQIIMDAGFVVALIIASPMILYQLWGFVSPALYTHEKKVVVPTIFGIVFLFVCGVVLAYVLIFPLTLKFLLNIDSKALTPMISASEYLGFEIYLCVAFGAIFELPIVLMGLTAMGLVTPMFLAKYRRWAIVGSLIAGTFITPDPTSMIVIAIPVYGLYELSIHLSRSVYRWRMRREMGDEVPPPSGPRSGPPSQGQIEYRREPKRLGAPD